MAFYNPLHVFHFHEIELRDALNDLGIHCELNDMGNYYTVKCSYENFCVAREVANRKKKSNPYHTNNLVGVMGITGDTQPVHQHFAKECPESEKEFFKGVLDYHKMGSPSANIEDCGNVRCQIEQYKKL